MPNHNKPIRDEMLEAYLDNSLSENERQEVERHVRADASVQAEVDLQSRVDAALETRFPLRSLSAVTLPGHSGAAIGSHSRCDSWPLSYRIATAAAAAILLLGVTWWLLPERERPALHFEAAPLVKVYHDTVQGGFEPYYECHDASRFAQTFLDRQGVSLKLAPLRDDARMLGLSYPGGLSRQTTAMLCEVRRQPVMVFVDRATYDSPVAMQGSDSEDAPRVFRVERDGLIFYEVTPHDAPQVVEFLVLAD